MNTSDFIKMRGHGDMFYWPKDHDIGLEFTYSINKSTAKRGNIHPKGCIRKWEQNLGR